MKKLKYKDFKKKIHKDFYENILTEYILRPISNRITFVLIRFFPKITANMVTGFSLIISIGFGICFLLAFKYNILWFFGGFLFLFFHILDTVDGDLARAKFKFFGEKTLNGSYFDALMHQYYNSIFFITVGYSLSIIFKLEYLFYLGILFGILIIITDLINSYIGIILDKNNLVKKDKDIRTIKNSKEKRKITFKFILISFAGLIGFAIVFFLGILFDYLFGFNYIKLFLFIFMGINIIIIHILTFIKLLKLK